jgi:hypothetical protein
LFVEGGEGGEGFRGVGEFKVLGVLEDEVVRLAREGEGRVGRVERQVSGPAAADAEGGDLAGQWVNGDEETVGGLTSDMSIHSPSNWASQLHCLVYF